MDKLLVIVDMVNGFINEGALADKNISRIITPVVSLVKQAIKDGVPIVSFIDTHSNSSEEFKLYPPHCIIGTNECELIDELKVYKDSFINIYKDSVNGFESPRFTKIMFDYIFSQITVVGCCTDICVYEFTNSLLDYIKQRNLNTEVRVLSDCVYTYNKDNHIADEIQFLTLLKLEKNGAKITTSKESI